MDGEGTFKNMGANISGKKSFPDCLNLPTASPLEAHSSEILDIKQLQYFSNELRESGGRIGNFKVIADSSHRRHFWKGGVWLLLTLIHSAMNEELLLRVQL